MATLEFNGMKSRGALGGILDQILWEFSGSLSLDTPLRMLSILGMVLKHNLILRLHGVMCFKKRSGSH